MSKIKIAHIICDLLPGGGQKSTIDLIRATNSEVKNFLILLEDKRSYEVDDIETLYICKNKKNYKRFDMLGDYLLSKKLSILLKKYKIDIAISHMEVTAKILRFVNIPKIYYMRVDITQELNTLKKRSFMRYLKRKILYENIFSGQYLITISQDTAKNISNFISPKKIETIYNPFDIESIKKLSLQKETILPTDYIIQIGSGIKIKRQDILLEAFSKISDKKIKLLLLGTEKNPKILDIVDKFDIRQRVIFHPFTKNPYPFIKNAKLLVVSSEREGLPRVIIESLILKTPVVSTDCDTGPREIMTEELKPYLALLNNPSDLANKIDLALENYPNIEKKYIEKFNIASIRDKFLAYIKTPLKDYT